MSTYLTHTHTHTHTHIYIYIYIYMLASKYYIMKVKASPCSIYSDSHTMNNLSIAFHAFAWCMLRSFLVDHTLLVRYVNNKEKN